MSWKDYVDDERALRRATECELMDTRAERDAAIAERDRLRRELEALRDAMVNEWCRGEADASSAALRLRFDAILRGES